ncbi:hypothetical protein KVP10_15275 [Candidimonas humi]|uniref:Uncharacterized protein n=1 Tax=Candidimonas humi TaxID=683355 RepID=A0ABV8P3T5_9BURK|nr:hypothetical protein [Candidimonas humi]MBV6306254.1 hypothetical protein [Candidimonas humi]
MRRISALLLRTSLHRVIFFISTGPGSRLGTAGGLAPHVCAPGFGFHVGRHDHVVGIGRVQADFYDPPLQYDGCLHGLQADEQQPQECAGYEGVVIWPEFDCYDQPALVRLLAHYATGRRPLRLELINIGEFPGAVCFIGLGQLPPEALRLLWAKWKQATASYVVGKNTVPRFSPARA